jgi:putative phosphoribosyl transferase
VQGYFRDRRAAGAELAVQLAGYRKARGLLVLALPRGGVPVAYEIAMALGAELDVLVVRKLGVPQQPELALGAIASGGATVFNDDVVGAIGLTRSHLDAIARAERIELERRERAYRGGRGPLNVDGRTVIVVDDGLATGASMRAAVAAVRSLQPAKVVVAVPVAPIETAEEFVHVADDFVCIETPRDFHSVGWWYREFDQTRDDEVHFLLDATHGTKSSAA